MSNLTIFLKKINMGYLYGLISSGTFGLIPLFTLPLLAANITTQTALVYRFSIATIFLGFFLIFKRERFLVRVIDLFKLIILSICYLCAVYLFFHAFYYLPSGVVATINFLYPVIVMLIMIIFFKEPFHLYVGFSLFFAFLGVMLLSLGQNGDSVSILASSKNNISNIFYGILFSLLAGLSNAIYFVGIQVARINNISGLMMTFYVLFFGSVISIFYALITGTFNWISGYNNIYNAFMLAIITAVISNLTLIISISKIGSTMAAILGVMEPLTAVIVGILVFHEPLSIELIFGIILIILSVMIVMIYPTIKKFKSIC